MREAYASAYDQMPDWIYVEAARSAKVEVIIHLIAFTVFLAEAFLLPFISAWRFATFAYHVLGPFRRMRQFLNEDDHTLGFEMQSAWSVILVAMYSQWGKPYLRYQINITFGPDWVWAVVGVTLGVGQIISIRYGAENRAAAMVFVLAYWLALALVIGLNAGLTYVHALLAPACLAYFLCILRLLRRSDGDA